MPDNDDIVKELFRRIRSHLQNKVKADDILSMIKSGCRKEGVKEFVKPQNFEKWTQHEVMIVADPSRNDLGFIGQDNRIQFEVKCKKNRNEKRRKKVDFYIGPPVNGQEGDSDEGIWIELKQAGTGVNKNGIKKDILNGCLKKYSGHTNFYIIYGLIVAQDKLPETDGKEFMLKELENGREDAIQKYNKGVDLERLVPPKGEDDEVWLIPKNEHKLNFGLLLYRCTSQNPRP